MVPDPEAAPYLFEADDSLGRPCRGSPPVGLLRPAAPRLVKRQPPQCQDPPDRIDVVSAPLYGGARARSSFSNPRSARLTWIKVIESANSIAQVRAWPSMSRRGALEGREHLHRREPRQSAHRRDTDPPKSAVHLVRRGNAAPPRFGPQHDRAPPPCEESDQTRRPPDRLRTRASVRAAHITACRR